MQGFTSHLGREPPFPSGPNATILRAFGRMHDTGVGQGLVPERNQMPFPKLPP
ncbi:hypothetical protein C8D77_12081 [Mesorhizobium loti]|uniref:Uncharacterized protein n=1 Tax=Rhizobium loti TaxID=381 RepID=A0A8E2W6A1_RHILI|nr:hypothetical protein C8D77_12081 [Mesorhizobium loti]